MSNPPSPAPAPRRAIDIVNASLKRRYAAERRFRIIGASAVVLGIGFVALLFISIVASGYTAFGQTYIRLPVTFSPSVLDPDGRLARGEVSPEALNQALLGVNFAALTKAALKDEFPQVTARADSRALNGLLSTGAPLQLRDMLARDPAVIGSEQEVWLLADDDVDMYMKGRATPVERTRGTGTARLTMPQGGLLTEVPALGAAVRLESTGADFRPVLDGVRRVLRERLEQTEREFSRLDRAIDDNIEERAQLSAELGAARARGDGDAALAALQARFSTADQRKRELDGRLAEQRQLRNELEKRLGDDQGREVLTADMPSFLVAIDGGIVKADAVSGNHLEGTLLVAPDSIAEAGPGTWEVVELSVPEGSRRLKDRQVAWLMQLEEQGRIAQHFNTIFFTNGTSREPELAGIAGALMGSFYTLVLTLLFSFPIGVGAAVYLQEFAPQNRLTDFIEVNINNLAAVPSIVFGLLGLAVFIGFFGVPRSTPLVAALVLTLATLPVVIIASRAALQSVPPSIREAALGVGASPLQTQLHHVLPLALPGMLTGAILGMARALGESAPLLMIGMIAFIVGIPTGFTDAATVLPVQIFLWADSPERGFVERTSAAIIVLLAFLILMNLAAVLLRRRFERRW